MLKILEPFWKGASLGRCAAPLKKGSRISQIPANGIHRTERHRVHWLSSLRNYFYACDVSSEKKRWCFFGFFFPPEKPKMFAGRRCRPLLLYRNLFQESRLPYQGFVLGQEKYHFMQLWGFQSHSSLYRRSDRKVPIVSLWGLYLRLEVHQRAQNRPYQEK